MESLDILEPGTPLCSASVLTLLQRVAKIFNSLKGSGGITLTKDDDNSWNISLTGATGGTGGTGGETEEIEVVTDVVTSGDPLSFEFKRKKIRVASQENIGSRYVSTANVNAVVDLAYDPLVYQASDGIRCRATINRLNVLKSTYVEVRTVALTPNMTAVVVDTDLTWDENTPELRKRPRTITLPSHMAGSPSGSFVPVLQGCVFWEPEA